MPTPTAPDPEAIAREAARQASSKIVVRDSGWMNDNRKR